jgi:hypothetical protein
MVKWVGPAQYEDAKTKTLMMLPTDYALVKVLHTPEFEADFVGQSIQEMGRHICQRQ